jgi:hypothetical protein
MKNYAPIAPVALLRQMKERGILGRYHLTLVQDVLKHAPDYTDLFHRQGYFVILDNGAAEGYEAMPAELMDAAGIVSASCICLPDELQNKNQTLRLIDGFLARAARRSYMNQWMAIPQGKDHNDILKCADEIVRTLGGPPAYWGVPRWISNNFGSRSWLVRELYENDKYNRNTFDDPFIHILGMSANLADDLRCARMPGVMGIDSANPVVMGQRGVDIGVDENYVHLPRKTEEWDFWEEKYLTPSSIRNIQWVRDVVNKNEQ